MNVLDIYPFALESFNRRDYSKMNLETLSLSHNITAAFHSAIDDVRACFSLMQFMIARSSMEKAQDTQPMIVSVSNISEFKKGKSVNRLYFEFTNELGQKGRGYYDRWNLSWEMDKNSMVEGDLKDAFVLVTAEAERNRKTINNYKGKSK